MTTLDTSTDLWERAKARAKARQWMAKPSTPQAHSPAEQLGGAGPLPTANPANTPTQTPASSAGGSPSPQSILSRLDPQRLQIEATKGVGRAAVGTIEAPIQARAAVEGAMRGLMGRMIGVQLPPSESEQMADVAGRITKSITTGSGPLAIDPQAGSKTFNPTDPVWWAGRGGEAVGYLGTLFFPASAASKGAQALGALPKIAARYGAAAAAVSSAVIETGSSRQHMKDELIKRGLSESEAGELAGMGALAYGSVAGLLDVVPMGELLTKTPGGRAAVIRILKSIAKESGTETAQEELAIRTERALGVLDESQTGQRRKAAASLGALASGGASVVTTPTNAPAKQTYTRELLTNPAAVKMFVRENPDGAQLIASKAKPTQADFQSVGIEGQFRPRQRERIADQVRETLAANAAKAHDASDQTSPPQSQESTAPSSSIADSSTAAPSPPLYRETSPQRAIKLLAGMDTQQGVKPEWHLSASKDMAIGQGDNAGILIEFDSSKVQARDSTSKPFAGVAQEKISNQSAAEMRDAVVSVTVKKGVKVPPVLQQRLDTFVRTEVDGDTVYTRPQTIEAMGAMAGGEEVVGSGGVAMPRGAAQAQGIAAQQGIGRPELANPGTTQQARTVVDAIDEVRKQEGEPGQESFKQWDEAAQQRLETDRAGEQRKMESMFASGQLPDAVDQRVQQRLTDEAAQRAAQETDPAKSAEAWVEVHRLANIYRSVGGSEIARSLVARRDPVMTKKERLRGGLLDAIQSSSPAGERKIADAQREIRNSEGADRIIARIRSKQVLDEVARNDARATLTAIDALRDRGVDIAELFDRIDAIADADATPSEVVDAVREFRRHKAQANRPDFGWRDWVKELHLGFILSAFSSQSANLTGGVFNTVYQGAVVRTVETIVNLAARRTGAATVGELPHMGAHFIQAAKSAFINAAQSWKHETPILEEEVNIWRELAGKEKIEGTAVVQMEDYHKAIPGKVGRVVRAPLMILGMADETIKTFNAYVEVAAAAYRRGRSAGLSGDALTQFIDKEVADKASDSWEDAILIAKNRALQQQLPKVVKKLVEMRNDDPTMMLYFTVPLISTPINSYRQATRMTPLATAQSAQKIWSHLRGTKPITGNVAVQEIAKNIIAWGIIALIAQWIDDEDEAGRPRITGSRPTSKSERARWEDVGIEPSSILIGGQYYSYGRIEPFATGLTMNVDMVKAWSRGENPVIALGASALRQVGDKTFLRGIADVAEVLKSVGSGDDNAIKQWATNFASAWVPNLIRSTMRAADDVQRDYSAAARTGTLRTGAYKALPAWNLPPAKVDRWGHDIEQAGSPWNTPSTDFLFRLLSPVQVRNLPKATRADMLIANWNNTHSDEEQIVLMRPMPMVTIKGKQERMTEEEWYTFEKRAGALALSILDNEKYLSDSIIQNPPPAAGKVIKGVIDRARKIARAEIARSRLATSENTALQTTDATSPR